MGMGGGGGGGGEQSGRLGGGTQTRRVDYVIIRAAKEGISAEAEPKKYQINFFWTTPHFLRCQAEECTLNNKSAVS